MNCYDEIWKPVVGFESKYLVSNLGRVKSIGTYNTCKKGIMKPMVNREGYLHINFFDNGRKKDIGIHRVVAQAFIPNPNGYKYVHHKDENPSNNCVDNLEWCTNSANIRYSCGRQVAQMDSNGNVIRVFNCISDASKELNIPVSNITKCCIGKRTSAGNYSWKYV